MKTSEQINELAAAMAKAQGEIEGAKKSSNNPFFKSKYADLSEVWDACRKPLSNNGLAVIQGNGEPFDGRIAIETLIVHTSGQWISSTLSATIKDFMPQTVGSCITYLRRYGLQAAIGIAPEDDDGNAASSPDNKRPTTPLPEKPKELTPGQLEFTDKVRVYLEESTDGKPIDLHRLRSYMISKSTKGIPEDDKFVITVAESVRKQVKNDLSQFYGEVA